jgi:hypothetical protein
MKHLKLFGLLVVAATAMMAFAANASANTVTDASGNGTPNIHSVSEEDAVDAVPGTNHVLLHTDIVDIKCESTVEGDVTTHGSGVTTSGAIDVLTFEPCTDNWVVHVVSKGTLEIHTTSTTGHGTGTLTSSGATVVATRFGVSCGYRTENTHIGTVTGGSPATLHIEASIPRHSGSFLCGGSNANWTGSYVTTETLKMDA